LVAAVAVLDDADVVIVARSGEQRLASSALPFGTHLGARLPAFATSTGRVLLAQLSRNELAAWLRGKTLPRLTPHTVCDKSAWKALIAHVASQGYCEATQEHELGVQALAVPLRDSTGRVVAAMNVVLSASDVRAQHATSLVPQYLRLMQLAAEEVRQVL
jgi:IclR family transcriptional regulator, pca regulon regulatory protein